MQKSKVLILGADGMLGHKLLTLLSAQGDLEVSGTVRKKSAEQYKGIFKIDKYNVIYDVDAGNFAKIQTIVDDGFYDFIINCIGIVKQRERGVESRHFIEFNSLFPHKLDTLLKGTTTTLIHISTDCVFSGKKGNYREADLADARDIYGLSKILGEVCSKNSLTLRTSIIGPELFGHKSLLDWFLAQKIKIKGYNGAIFSGLTTLEFSKVILEIIRNKIPLGEIYHVSSSPISKYDLLCLVKEVYQIDIEIEKDDEFKVNKSLDSEKFQRITGYNVPTWPTMIREMRSEK